MPKPYPKEFRDDVVAVVWKGQAPSSQIAKDFGISEGTGYLPGERGPWPLRADCLPHKNGR